ncbi:hypothetical protein L596_025683 [Steinernema carpocapsae]|nr:hypothetical protein L596_025683 [Steinernema carpocapsae]
MDVDVNLEVLGTMKLEDKPNAQNPDDDIKLDDAPMLRIPKKQHGDLKTEESKPRDFKRKSTSSLETPAKKRIPSRLSDFHNFAPGSSMAIIFARVVRAYSSSPSDNKKKKTTVVLQDREARTSIFASWGKEAEEMDKLFQDKSGARVLITNVNVVAKNPKWNKCSADVEFKMRFDTRIDFDQVPASGTTEDPSFKVNSFEEFPKFLGKRINLEIYAVFESFQSGKFYKAVVTDKKTTVELISRQEFKVDTFDKILMTNGLLSKKDQSFSIEIDEMSQIRIEEYGGGEEIFDPFELPAFKQ